MTTPWGTPPEVQVAVRYTVVGFYGYNGQRFCQHVTAVGPREAEDLARSDLGRQRASDGTPSAPQVCGVLAVVAGQIQAMDTYATYLDPDVQDG